MKLFYVALLIHAVQSFQSMSCINFYGLETESMKPVCSWVHPPEYYLDILIDRMNIDTIRIPLSGTYIARGEFSELRKLVTVSRERNLRIIFDYHRIRYDKQSPTPMDGQSITEFMDAWLRVLHPFQDDVYAVSLFNEDQTTNMWQIVEYSLATIHTIELNFPNKFIYIVGGGFWNQQTHGLEILFNSIDPGRLLIDIHWYPFIGNRSYIEASTTDAIPPDNYFIGEIGWTADDHKWFEDIVQWSHQKGFNKFCGWTIAHSDQGGTFWKDDCLTFFPSKMEMFKRLFYTHPRLRLGRR